MTLALDDLTLMAFASDLASILLALLIVTPDISIALST
jgi:hypothetical protein